MQLVRLESLIQLFASFKEFEQWVDQVEREVPTGILIEIVPARLRKADIWDHYPLSRMLETFPWRAKRNCEALDVLDAVIDCYPDDVRAPLNKAVRLLYFLGPGRCAEVDRRGARARLSQRFLSSPSARQQSAN